MDRLKNNNIHIDYSALFKEFGDPDRFSELNEKMMQCRRFSPGGSQVCPSKGVCCTEVSTCSTARNQLSRKGFHGNASMGE